MADSVKNSREERVNREDLREVRQKKKPQQETAENDPRIRHKKKFLKTGAGTEFMKKTI